MKTKQQKGLSLVEVILAMAVLLLVLPLVFVMFSYVATAFQTGETQADLQQNLRLVVNYVADELRYADMVVVANEPGEEEDYSYLYTDDYRLMHREYDPDAEQWIDHHLFEEISRNVNMVISFEPDEEDSGVISLSVYGECKASGREHTLDVQVGLLNTSPEDQRDEGAEGFSVKYRTPDPGSAEIGRMNILNQDGERQYRHQEGEHVQLSVVIDTHQVPENTVAELQVLDPDGWLLLWSDNAEVIDNRAEFTCIFSDDIPAGSYRIRAEIELHGELITLTRSYTIYNLLTVQVEGSGHFTLDDGDISEEGLTSLERRYHEQNEVVLQAVADPGWEFVSWTEEHSEVSEQAEYTFTMKQHRNLVADFQRQQYLLVVDVEGEGTVSVDPDEEYYHYGDEVQLTAEPEEGWEFAQWTGDAEGTEAETLVVLDEDKEITAVFEQVP